MRIYVGNALQEIKVTETVMKVLEADTIGDEIREVKGSQTAKGLLAKLRTLAFHQEWDGKLLRRRIRVP